MQEFRPVGAVEVDAQLAEAIARGEAEAVAEVARRYVSPMYAHARRLTGDDAVAQEVVADVLEHAPRSVERFDPATGFAPWLAGEVERVAGAALEPVDVELTWELRRAADAVGVPEDPSVAVDADRCDRIRRRVEHLLDGRDLEPLLDEPWVRARPPEQLVDRLNAGASNSGTATADRGVAVDEATEAVIDAAGPSSGDQSAGARRTARPVVFGVTAAIVALFGGILLLSALSGTPEPVDVEADLVPTGALDGAEGSVEITELDAGLRIELDVSSLPPRPTGQRYETWITLADGTDVPAGTFRQGGDVTLSAGVGLDDAVEFTIGLGPSDRPSTGPERVVLKLDLP